MHFGINGSFIRKRMTCGLVTIVIRITHYYGTVIYIYIYTKIMRIFCIVSNVTFLWKELQLFCCLFKNILITYGRWGVFTNFSFPLRLPSGFRRWLYILLCFMVFVQSFLLGVVSIRTVSESCLLAAFVKDTTAFGHALPKRAHQFLS